MSAYQRPSEFHRFHKSGTSGKRMLEHPKSMAKKGTRIKQRDSDAARQSSDVSPKSKDNPRILLNFEWSYFAYFFKVLKRQDFTTLFTKMLNHDPQAADPFIQDIKQIQFGTKQPLASTSQNSSSTDSSQEKETLKKPSPYKNGQFVVLWQTDKKNNHYAMLKFKQADKASLKPVDT